PVWVTTKFGSAHADEIHHLDQALRARWTVLAPGQPLNWVLQQRQPDGPGSAPVTQCMAGKVPQPHVVNEGGARIGVQLLKGQNHGLFLDMAEGRRWLRENARGARVLNLFAYTCGFSVAAIEGGAEHVVNLDMSRAALSRGRDNHRLNGHDLSQVSFLGHDLFKSWGKVINNGPYDLVIIDPPSFQKGSFLLTKDYQRVL
ncbi:MAG: class I SAM-dependent methyltransferase, partial [Hydrogenophaga sp.]